MEWTVAVGAMTAGSMLLMWLREIMTEQGWKWFLFESPLIFAGIVSQLPQTLQTIGASLFDTSNGTLHIFNWFTVPINPLAFWVVLAMALGFLGGTLHPSLRLMKRKE